MEEEACEPGESKVNKIIYLYKVYHVKPLPCFCDRINSANSWLKRVQGRHLAEPPVTEHPGDGVAVAGVSAGVPLVSGHRKHFVALVAPLRYGS